MHFKKGLGVDDRGQDRPIRFRVGRFAYETTDRRFIARNEWRNTTNSFEGFRLTLGREANDWELDLFGMMPVRRLQTKFDKANENLWFAGAIGTWRKWSDYVTFQPYYKVQIQEADPNGFTATNRLDREIHMPGFRAYGRLGIPGQTYILDFDASYNQQLGFSGPLNKMRMVIPLKLAVPSIILGNHGSAPSMAMHRAIVTLMMVKITALTASLDLRALGRLIIMSSTKT